MADIVTQDERFPIGPFQPKDHYTQDDTEQFIHQITVLPSRLEMAVSQLTDEQLDTPYREGGWTIRQVVHHLPDSHMNAYIRMKWALTEDNPLIKAYEEQHWATTAETRMTPSISLELLKALHIKWVALMRLLTNDDLARTFVHPSNNKSQRLDRVIATYAWHGEHHLAHITHLKARMGWK